jgi:hypothetical protein
MDDRRRTTWRKVPQPEVSRYLILLATAILLGVCFLVYYLTYVQQHREYLLNRNYRVLATLGEQMSETLANQAAILASYMNAFEDREFDESGRYVLTYKRAGLHGPNVLIDQAGHLEQTEGLNEMRAEIHYFAPRLNHVQIIKLHDKGRVQPRLERRDGEWVFQLASIDLDGDHEASATISLQDLSKSFSSSIMDTFDDVLLTSADGDIVFQKRRIGPHYSSLSDLMKTETQTSTRQGKSDTEDRTKGGSVAAREGSEQLKETYLAGVPYMVFLEPVTIDLNRSARAGRQETQRLILIGLVPSRRFRWQSLAISYRAVIFFSSALLLLWLSTPVIKIFFFNQRERLRLPEIVLLPLVWVLIAGVLTSICLQTIYFNLRHDDTDSQLENLSKEMAANIKSEIRAMREQLVAACKAADEIGDRRFPYLVVRTNVLDPQFLGFQRKPPVPYPYFANVFWTDANGRQTVKWSSTSTATPLIDVGRFDFFRNLESGNHHFFLDESLSFRLDSLLPPNQENYVAVLGMKTSDCDGVPDGEDMSETKFAFLSTRTLSLIDPTLPLGFGFALVDDTGLVLFHSDKYRNKRENFLVETSNDRELTASLYGHSNLQNFSLEYRGSEVRARVVPVAGVTQAPWSLIVFRDAQYVQTYDLEIITMAGTLLLLYVGIPALIVCGFYFLVRPRYVPEWLWPSELAKRTYLFQIEAGLVMLALSATLIFLRGIEESLYAAVAAGYVTLIIVFWSYLDGKPSSRSKVVFGGICCLAALVMVAIPLTEGWWWLVPIGLVPFPFVLALRASENLAVASWWLPKLSYRSAYNIRALVLLTVIGILPPLSFFRNSMLLEDHLHVRAAQLHAATAWNARERMIENLDKDVPGLSGKLVGDNLGGPKNRCDTNWDFYLDSYFDTRVKREQHPETSSARSSDSPFDPWFLQMAHDLHHAYNDIGAEALGVLRNPSLPEVVYVDKSPQTVRESSRTTASGTQQKVRDVPEWEWLSADPHRLQLRMHQGAYASSYCAAADKRDLVVSSTLPDKPISTEANVFTWLAVIVMMGPLFGLVTRKIFLFDIREPLSHTPQEIRKMLQGRGNVIVLPASTQDWSPDLAGERASRIDIRELAVEPAWAEKFDQARLEPESPAIIENFDWELGYPECNRQRLILLERLVAHLQKVIIVSAVDPFPFLIHRSGPENDADAGRWAAVLGGFTRVNLSQRSPWPMGELIRKDLPALWEECHVQRELHRIGEQLWHARNPDIPLAPEQVVSEVMERAAEYYYLEWRSCTQEECFLLTGLAEDGMVNPKNAVSLRQLLRRRLIVRAPQFRIMNESFRRFTLAQSSDAMRSEWEADAASSGWGKARGAFSTVLVLVGLFLLATQQQFLQTSTGLLTAAGGCVAALLKLIGVVQGRSADT